MVPSNHPGDNRIHQLSTTIREATEDDVRAIRAIFNHAIAHTTASFYKEPRTVEQRMAWFRNRLDRYAVLVAEQDSGVVGWAAMDPWTEKHGYRITTEISYYVAPDFHGQGIGSQLVEHLIQSARQNNFENMLAKICENNQVSIKLAERFGFELVGTLRAIGRKFGQTWDVHYYQKQL